MRIRLDPTDDPAFVAIVERIAVKLFNEADFEEVFIIEIKNWFDHKWLKFSGIGRVPFDYPRDSHPQVALDEFYQDKITLPPFTPDRVLRQQWHPVDQSRTSTVIYSKSRRQHSSWNLQRRISQYAKSALFVWFSSGTRSNDRGSLMIYQTNDEAVAAWYLSFRNGNGWKLDRCKGISKEIAKSLFDAPPAT